jgi:hypothetical protein
MQPGVGAQENPPRARDPQRTPDGSSSGGAAGSNGFYTAEEAVA